jgi:serine/threonine protein kinase
MKNPESNASGETTKSFMGGQKLFGRYKLARLLGRGGMGVVWLARDEKLERDVALKFLPAMFVNDRASLDDLKRETRRSLELTHPNIVRTYDFVEDNEAAGISMEYVDADTLRNRRIDQPFGIFEPPVMADWVIQLCNALDYAHHHAAIVHRDLKPANLMVNQKNHLKVADFGISRSLVESSTQVTGMHGVSGTLVYMSPQQLSGEEPTALDDVYGVGATLYELCTTRPPFYTGDISGQVYKKVAPTMTDRRISLGVAGAEIPQIWEATIAACLAKDPAERPQSAGEIAARLGLIEAASYNTPRPTSPATSRPTTVRPMNAAPPPPVPPSPPTATAPMTSPHSAPGRKFSGAMLGSALAVGVILIAAITWHFGSKRSETQPIRPAKTIADSTSSQADEKRPQGGAPTVSAAGTVWVDADPPEAIVQIGDGPPNKERKPTILTDVKAGRQTMTVSLDGYDTQTFDVDVKEIGMTKAGKVKLSRSTGAFRIMSVPPKLTYELKELKGGDHKFTKTGTTDDPVNVDAGDYEITLIRNNWKPLLKPVTVVKGKNVDVLFEYPTGLVHITSDPPGATIIRSTVQPPQPVAESSQAAPQVSQSEPEPPQAETQSTQEGATPAPAAKELTKREKTAAKNAATAAKRAAELAAKNAAAEAEKTAREERDNAIQSGTKLSAAPLWHEEPPGPVRYFATLEGYEPAEVTGDVLAGVELSLTVTLKKIGASKAPAKQPIHHRPRQRDDDDDQPEEHHHHIKEFFLRHFFG